MKVGISGHQELGAPAVKNWVRSQMEDELRRTIFDVGISSLADGADQMFAEVILSLGKLLEIVIPCRGYESAFAHPEAARRFRKLRLRAVKSHMLDYSRPSEEAFYQAGRYIVDDCELMFFVWNGKPAQGRGGTADIVDYARRVGREFVWINPIKAKLSNDRHT